MAELQTVIPYVENDQETLRITWEDQDISGMSTIELRFRRPDGTRVDIAAVVVVDGSDPEAPDAITDFDFSAGDLVPGDSTAEIFTVSGGREDSFPDQLPMILRVRSKV